MKSLVITCDVTFDSSREAHVLTAWQLILSAASVSLHAATQVVVRLIHPLIIGPCISLILIRGSEVMAVQSRLPFGPVWTSISSNRELLASTFPAYYYRKGESMHASLTHVFLLGYWSGLGVNTLRSIGYGTWQGFRCGVKVGQTGVDIERQSMYIHLGSLSRYTISEDMRRATMLILWTHELREPHVQQPFTRCDLSELDWD